MNYTKRLKIIGKLVETGLEDADPLEEHKGKYRNFLVSLYEDMSDEVLEEAWKNTLKKHQNRL